MDSRISLCLALLDSDSTKEMVEDWCVKSEVNRNTGIKKVVSREVQLIKVFVMSIVHSGNL